MFERDKKYFEFEKLGTDFRTEILGGVTTFMTMAYIIVVNPSILSNQAIGAGMDFQGVFMATCLASAVATLVMALVARYPIALAPGMGLNAFFSFEIVKASGVPWQVALGMVFISGAVFLILTLLKVREMIVNAIPDTLKHAVAAGIGLFIAFIGLQHAGIVVDDPATLVKMGDLSAPATLISLVSLAAAGMLMASGRKGAVLWGILLAGVLGLLFGEIKPENMIIPTLCPFQWQALVLVVIVAVLAVVLKTMKVWGGLLIAAVLTIATGLLAGWIEIGPEAVVALPPDVGTTAFKLDILGVFSNWRWVALTFVLLFFDLFDTVGTLIGVSEKAGLIKDGKLPRASRALSADALGTIAGSFLGTSTTTSYIESTAGVTAGARTGFASIITALLFLLAIFFYPLVQLLAVDMVTAPALILVGALMMTSAARINWNDFYEAAPAFLVIVLMPLTYSISKGLVAGFISWPLLQAAAGRARKVHPFVYGVASVLVIAVAAGHLVLEPAQTIHQLCEKQDADAVENLLDKNPELANDTNANLQTPLHIAARQGDEKLVRMLLESGASLEAKDDKCRTPLHAAALQGRLETVKLLVEKGADIDVRDRSGATPLDLARKNNHEIVLKFLKKNSGSKL